MHILFRVKQIEKKCKEKARSELWRHEPYFVEEHQSRKSTIALCSLQSIKYVAHGTQCAVNKGKEGGRGGQRKAVVHTGTHTDTQTHTDTHRGNGKQSVRPESKQISE